MERLNVYATKVVGGIIRDESVPMQAKEQLVASLKSHIDGLLHEKKPIARAKELHKRAEEAYEQDITNKFLTANNCTKGCHACCHMNVDLHLAEVPYFKKIFKKLDKDKQEKLRERLKKQLEFDHADYFKLENRGHSACIFLEDGLCSIYEQRPLMCRKYFVRTDPKDCWQDGDALIVGHINMEILSSAISTIENGEFKTMAEAILEKDK